MMVDQHYWSCRYNWNYWSTKLIWCCDWNQGLMRWWLWSSGMMIMAISVYSQSLGTVGVIDDYGWSLGWGTKNCWIYCLLLNWRSLGWSIGYLSKAFYRTVTIILRWLNQAGKPRERWIVSHRCLTRWTDRFIHNSYQTKKSGSPSVNEPNLGTNLHRTWLALAIPSMWMLNEGNASALTNQDYPEI